MLKDLMSDILEQPYNIDFLRRNITLSNIKKSPYYKGADLWDKLLKTTIECDIFEFKTSLKILSKYPCSPR